VTRDPGRPHPLAPLDAAEIECAVAAVRAHPSCPAQHRFRAVSLAEPTRSELRAYREHGRMPARCARVDIFDLVAKVVTEVVVALETGDVTGWTPLDGRRQPGLFAVEQQAARQAVLADPRWQEAMRRRGIEDLASVATETGPGGRYGTPWDDRPRIGRTLTFLRPPGTLNYYAHPVQGLVAYVDLQTYEVLEVEDEEVVPVPSEPAEFHDGVVATSRPPLAEIRITQPRGPGFSIEDGLLRWEKWSLRPSLHPVDGLVIHELAYDDGGRRRPVLHRAGLAELVVPYGDPSANQHWRNAFDAAEAGIGRAVTSLELGCDCLGEITYLDAVVADDEGLPRVVGNAICIHEEDWNVSWKHVYRKDGVAAVRRSRRLVISCWATLGNYDYGFFWYLYTEGHVEYEVKPTGIVYTGATAPDATDHSHGELVAPGVYAPHHQHVFCVRLDPEVDGPHNSVDELDVVPDPPETADARRVGFHVERTRLSQESEGRRDNDARRARSWLITNDRVRNRLGNPVAYALVPKSSAVMLAGEGSAVGSLAGFARHNLWVSAYVPDERHPAGEYPAWGDAGLPQWTEADRPIDDTEIVLWHCFTATHVVRPEDWPVMPVEHLGFVLKPVGFFDRNPALDLPPPSHERDGSTEDCCHAAQGQAGSPMRVEPGRP
jgi:primary-amine oxidase